MNTKQQGLTLVELMVTLAVAIILIAVGTPLYTGMVANNRATAEANSLVGALKLARSEAVKRGSDVVVCSADSGACGDETAWDNGWTVFSDVNSNGDIDDDEALRNWDALNAQSTITVVSGGPKVTFGATGEADATATFQMQNSGATNGIVRCITVAASGQIRSTRGACP